MITQISDTDIRMDVRSYLAQHRIDMQRIQLRIFGGTVRMTGEVYHLGGKEQPVPLCILESLERDVVMTRGVRHACFDFSNWRRMEGGQWEPLSTARPSAARGNELDEDEEIPSVE